MQCGGLANCQICIWGLSNWPQGGSMEIVDLCKLDIDRDDIYYLAPTGLKSTWEPRRFESLGINVNSSPMSTVPKISGYSLFRVTWVSNFKSLWGGSRGIITVYTCPDIAVLFLLQTQLLFLLMVPGLQTGSGLEIGQGVGTFYWGNCPQPLGCPSFFPTSLSREVRFGSLPLPFPHV